MHPEVKITISARFIYRNYLNLFRHMVAFQLTDFQRAVRFTKAE
jgi:hypothetical protein